MMEEPIWLPSPQGPMLGIVSGGAAAAGTGVVIVVGGAQYRTGSHRQFVQLARALACAGYPTLRFDMPGMGDSPGAPVPFDHSEGCIGAAIDGLLGHQPTLTGVVLWGLCDGASAALLHHQSARDARVTGMVLLNPWVRSEAGLARTHVKHYYRQRLMEPAFWRKLLSGGVGLQALRGLWFNLRGFRKPQAASAELRFQDRMAQGWRAFPGRILLILSGRDLTAQEFEEYVASDPAWAGALKRPTLAQHRLPHADHTCSRPEDLASAIEATRAWLEAGGLDATAAHR